MSKPKVSIILPVYNSQEYIKEAIESISSQSFKDWELIIIDDASSDQTPNILKKYKDKRIIGLKNDRNMGVAISLNRGLKQATGEYIARIDADDICFPNRFELQVEFLDNNPATVIVGSNAEIINSSGDVLFITDLPTTDIGIRNMLFVRNPLIHPSVMFRRKILGKVGNYNIKFNGAEDYELWFRMLKSGRAYNFKKPLIKRRVHDNVVTKKFRYKVELKAMFTKFVHLKDFINIYLYK